MQSEENSPWRKPTPWRIVFKKFGLSQAAFARLMGRHKSKISRSLRCDKGLISGKDQETIINLAKRKGVDISATDLVPR